MSADVGALSAEEAGLLAEALRRHEPWLEWSGKRERPWFEVDPVALHMHARVSTQAVLRVLARQDVQRDLFADPQLDYAKAVQFYRHDVDWANRMILGDSLQVMASLARRENLAGIEKAPHDSGCGGWRTTAATGSARSRWGSPAGRLCEMNAGSRRRGPRFPGGDHRRAACAR